MLDTATKNSLVGELGKIVGTDFVSTNKADLQIYSYDLTTAEPNWPDVVVLPKSVAELREIVSLANTRKIPVTPYIAGGNVGGLTIPLEGGITLDLKRMNRIVEVNEIDMYAVVEPGVTFGQIKAYLSKYHPTLMYTYAFSPQSTGVMTNAIVQGLDNISFRYGAASHWVTGLEVLLATGELVKIGSCAASQTWQAIVPFPELSGLFLGWQGTTGVITKMAVSLWPKPKFSAALSYATMDLEGADKLLRTISRTRIPDDLIGTSFALSKVNQLAMEHKKAPIYPAQPRSPGEPEFTVSVEVTGNTENELKAKVEAIEEVVRDEIKDKKIMGPYDVPSSTSAFPLQALGVLSGGGGLNWVGTYGPMSKWLEAVTKGCELQDKYGITRSAYTRIMDEGHFAGLRWMLPYNKEDPEMVKRIRDLCAEQLEMVLDVGYIPYKTPVWAVRKLEERVSPDWLKLHREVKQMLDPNNILNPGRWGAPQK